MIGKRAEIGAAVTTIAYYASKVQKSQNPQACSALP
jgi:hypothetical protein